MSVVLFGRKREMGDFQGIVGGYRAPIAWRRVGTLFDLRWKHLEVH
jgi:hypothetical protein